MNGNAPTSSGFLIGIGLLAVPSVVFLLGGAMDVFLPRSVFSGRQWLINGMSMAVGGGAIFSLLICTPIAVGATIWNFRRLTPRDQVAAGTLAALSLLPVLLLAFYVLMLSQI